MFRPLRRSDKSLDQTATIDLLQRGTEGVLATLGEDGYPYAVPVNYVYYNNKIYIHCAKTGHKIDNINFHKKVSFSVYLDVKVIGEELTTHYQSVVVFGQAKALPATKDVLMALVKKYSDLEESKAKDMIQKEIHLTDMIEIKIEHVSGKLGNK